MGLQVWLPMNGNLNNYGLSSSTATGGVVNSNGKIGMCYLANKSTPITISQNISSTSEWSVAFWAKFPASMGTSTAWETMFFFPTINSNAGSNSSNVISWTSYYNIKIWDETNHQWFWAAPGKDFNYDIWHHWVFTNTANGEGVQCKIYIDGNLIGTYNNTTHQLKIRSGNITIGSGISTGGFYINDFRLYDNELDANQIKKISQGLILHYPLSNSGGRDNNIKRSSIVNRGCTSLTYNNSTGEWTAVCPVNSSSWGVGFYINDASIKWAFGETWVVSMEVYVPQSIGWNCDINNKPDLADISSYTGNDYDVTGQRLTYTNGVSSKTLQAGWNKIWFSQTASSSTYGLSNYSTNWGIVTSSLSSSITIKLRNIKGEIIKSGDVIGPSSYVPNNSDINYQSNIIYDVSGYNNNGNINGTIDYSSNTPKHHISTTFNGSSYITFNSLPAETTSISCWVKTNGIPSSSAVVFVDYGSKISLGFNSGNSFIVHNGSSNGGTGSRVLLGSYYKSTDWNHVVVIKTGSNTYDVYLNCNKLSSTSSNYWTMNKNEAIIGCRYASAYNSYFTGQISDFRAYATALSTDDILELYKTPSYLASNAS